ncbi:NAD(P)/FAD-dependent oxidoreductase [Candidatus Woesearchaeota archaeon]|nr:NAD(P)/FAD-dependent oxidoreductase [Candidatus Woesearchaeota archaeon]
MNKQIVIIGAGVAGASTAIKLAEQYDSSKIHLVDKQDTFKKACSGILTYAVDDLIKIPEEIIVSKVKRFRFIAPNNEQAEINFKRPDIVCERELLNKYLNEKAVDLGVQIHRPANLESIQKNKVIINALNEKRTIHATHLVGADGSKSTVAKLTGLEKQRKYFIGAKAIVEYEHDGAIEVYTNIGCFAWLVPHGENKVEIGTMSYPWQGAVFDSFLKKFNGRIISKEGALIPVYDPLINTYTKFNNIHTYLVGDAAAMVKATTGGSIIQSFIASKYVADAIIKNKSHSFSWKKKLGLGLLTHLQIRNVIDKFKEDDWNKAVSLLKLDSIKNVIEKETRDHPIMLMLKLIIAKPSILNFAKKLF